MFWKKLIIPASSKELQAVQMWEVRWASRHGFNFDAGGNASNCTPQLECFTSEAQAQEFAAALQNAFKVLRYSGTGMQVTVTKAE